MIRLGRIRLVTNTPKEDEKSIGNEAEQYQVVWVQRETDRIYFPLMLTQNELDTAAVRAKKQPEDMPKLRLPPIRRFLRFIRERRLRRAIVHVD